MCFIWSSQAALTGCLYKGDNVMLPVKHERNVYMSDGFHATKAENRHRHVSFISIQNSLFTEILKLDVK
jgi:hypothetical protein